MQEDEAAADSASNGALYRTSFILMSIVILVGALIAVLTGALITGSIVRQLGAEPGTIRSIAERMAAGDFSVSFETGRKPAGAFAEILTMIGRLTEIVGNIQSATENVTGGGEQISMTAQSLSQGATEQAASSEEVSASVEQMAATIKQNTDNSLATEACRGGRRRTRPREARPRGYRHRDGGIAGKYRDHRRDRAANELLRAQRGDRGGAGGRGG